jgi:hypothetical protein
MYPRRPRWRWGRGGQVAAVPPPAAWYEVAYANPGRDRTPEVAAGEAAALGAARRMSAQGELVDIFLALEDGSRRAVASFMHGQPLLGAAARVPAAAEAAQAPVSRIRGTSDAQAAARRYPDGISPLPVAATSGGPLRPRRLLHPDGTRLDCRPGGRPAPPWAGIAEGVVPAAGVLAPGWLQVVRRTGIDNPGLVTVHPALISPSGVDPYGHMSIRQRRRFGEFDLAEAAGSGTAWLDAVLVDEGDFITTRRGDILQVTRTGQAAGSRGVLARIAADGISGSGIWIYLGAAPVQVVIPARHPAEDGPQARRLFAPGRAGKHSLSTRPALLAKDR